MASARWLRSSASAYLPCSWYTLARLLRLPATSGWFEFERFLSYGKRALIELRRLGIFALKVVHHGEVVEARSHIGMAQAERFLPYGKRALVELSRLSIFTLRVVRDGEVA